MKKKLLILICILITFAAFITGIFKHSKNFIDLENVSKYVRSNYKNGDNVRIAIIDSGLNSGLDIDNIINFSSDDDTIDYINHGDIITYIISNNELGIVQNSEVYMLKVVNKYGIAATENVYKALEWCLNNSIDIINMSISFSVYSENVECMVNSLLEKGTVIVTSISNDSKKTDYPSMYNGVICVGKTTTPKLYSEDNSIIFEDIGIVQIGENKKKYEGNSFLAPVVTGIIASIYKNTCERRYTNAELIALVKDVLNRVTPYTVN